MIKYIPSKNINDELINQLVTINPKIISSMSKNIIKKIDYDFIVRNYSILAEYIPITKHNYIDLYHYDKNNIKYMKKSEKKKIEIFTKINRDKIIDKKELEKLIKFFP